MTTYGNLGEMLLRRQVMGRTQKISNNPMAKQKAGPLQKAANPMAQQKAAPMKAGSLSSKVTGRTLGR